MAADQLQGPGAGSTETWSPRSPEQAHDAEEEHRAAWQAYQQARNELEPCLVERTEAARRHSDLRGRQRFLQSQIEAAEAEVARAQGQADGQRDWLAGIRAKLGIGGPGLPAA